jgi:phosphoenolpyruvate carboxykinase (GTP)
MPRVFYVNWFRKSADGRWLWPGFGDNSRVLKWIFERVAGQASAVESPIGLLPAPGAIDTTGLKISADDMRALLSVDAKGWLADFPAIRAHYAKFGDAIPAALRQQLDALEARLKAAQ